MPAAHEIAIGMNARLFPGNWRPAREEIAFAAANAFEAIQFPGPEAGLDAERLGDSLEATAAALATANLTPVMEIMLHGGPNGRTASGASAYDLLLANLPAITTLGCRCVHVHPVPRAAMAEVELRAFEAALVPEFHRAVALAAEHRFTFGVEHNAPPTTLVATPERTAALLDAVPGLGFVWDLNHTPVAMLDGYLRLLPRMSMLHVADTLLPEVNYHLPLGQGNIDFVAYGRALRAGGFHGPAILEIGGLPLSGGYGRDTDAALCDSHARFAAALQVD
ncbi:MAG TPA: TIM barrel protein [Chloroflexia bacterium]|nr:TIM barrel protein [Chloroflexia bacterium]